MINSIFRRRAVATLMLCALALTACGPGGGQTTMRRLGPLASEEEMREMLSGYSFPLSPRNGQTYYAADGTTKSFTLYADGGHVTCDGTWRVEGSYLYQTAACYWPDQSDSGDLKKGQPYDYKSQGHLLGFGGKDLEFVMLEGPTKNEVYQLKRSERLEGFPRQAEYDEIRRQLGL